MKEIKGRRLTKCYMTNSIWLFAMQVRFFTKICEKVLKFGAVYDIISICIILTRMEEYDGSIV
jgi:hypothetical protein